MLLPRGLLLAAVLSGGTVWAGVEGTHHDLRIYGLPDEASVCSYCHVPHRAQGDVGLFARSGSAEELGPVGSFCYSCHDGTVVPTALIEAPDGSVGLAALLGSHGYRVAAIEGLSGGMETGAGVLGSGLVDPSVGGAAPVVMDCNACHDPHSDQFAPFLKVPLGALCQKCHAGSDGLGKGRWTSVADTGADNWAHPVDMPARETGHERSRGMTSEMSFHGPDPVFDIPTATPAMLRDPGTHWDTGGHLLGDERLVGCVTCHSAHLPVENLLVATQAPVPEGAVCAGCHTDGANRENPGTTPYYHPVLASSQPPYLHDHAAHGAVPEDPNLPSSGTLDLFVALPEGWPLGSNDRLVCESCHRAHRGVPGERCLRGGPNRALVICNECHGVDEANHPNVPDLNWHHPTGPLDYTDPAVAGFPTELGWSRGKELPGDLSDGLQCVDCHTELAKSAHNW
ncbi:MAG: cytochrome c3 family protein [Deferrisomatales bacterium]|nr:cytochrome c3 family protein [Deferrisomatales bacterium]